MTLPYRKPGVSPLRQYLSFLLLFWLLLILARLAFAVYNYELLLEAPTRDVLKAFYIGCRFDGRLAAILAMPLGIMLTIPPLGRRISAWAGRIASVYFLVFLALWLVYAGDFGFYTYLGERLNFTAIELLEDFWVSLAMVWESYPVIPIFLGVLLLAWLCSRLLRRLCARAMEPHWSAPGKILAWLFGFLVCFWAAYGQVSSNFFPLRWSNAYFTPDPTLIALGLNPVQNLFDTYRAAGDDGFDLEATRRAYPLMSAYLGVDEPDARSLSFARQHAGTDEDNRPNVVIIVAESLSHFKTSFAPGPDDPTPFIKGLAGRSRYYPNYYANARTTARGVFSLITGIPDVTGSSTGSRNPLVANQRVVADQFQGYDKYYMLGGNTGWANIRGVLGNNIQGLRILEESFWKSPNADVWGVSDLDMLREAQEFFSAREQGAPFLAVIQLASFHRPYTVPDNIPGFAKRALSEEARLNYGFISEDEYNSMRLMDFSLAEFFRLSAAAPWYRNTIFVVLGDHGIRDSKQNMNASYEAAQLGPWHVPLIIHWPGRVAPAVDPAPASHVDVFPTMASLAGLGYTNWTLGRDLLDGRFADSRAAFISGNNETPIRLVRDGYCYLDNRAGREALYKLDDPSGVDYREREPERFAQMRELARGMQTTAKYMLYNNKK